MNFTVLMQRIGVLVQAKVRLGSMGKVNLPGKCLFVFGRNIDLLNITTYKTGKRSQEQRQSAGAMLGWRFILMAQLVDGL